jgi:hypothetical protein
MALTAVRLFQDNQIQGLSLYLLGRYLNSVAGAVQSALGRISAEQLSSKRIRRGVL